jgi:CRP/FNR family cyclic AMP-dependent transcriptional regulator
LEKTAANNEFDRKAFLVKAGVGKSLLTFHPNDHVFLHGEAADKVFYIQKGRVKVVVLSEQGKEAVTGIFEAGQFFGEGCLSGHALRLSTTIALEECKITSITKAAMLATLRNESVAL